jgi:hypothetical protein
VVGVFRGPITSVRIVIVGAVIPPLLVTIAVPRTAVTRDQGKPARDQNETHREMTN